MDYTKTLNLPRTTLPMRANLPQREKEILKSWEKKKIYDTIRKKRKGSSKFILHDGPPYANGDIHLGQALNKVLKDIVIKYKTMQNFDAPFIPGWDCHGLPVEHQLFKNLGINKNKISRLEFRKKAGEYALSFVRKQKEEFKRLGVFARWDKPYLTMHPSYEAEIIRVFGKLAQNGYIYRALRPIHWCINCQTALAEAEIEYAEKKSPSIYVKFPLKDKLPISSSFDLPIYFLIWTTTPWTIPANQSIAFHPDFCYCFVRVKDTILILAEDLLDKIKKEIKLEEAKVLSVMKGKELVGIIYNHPFIERKSKTVLADFVTLTEGTGCVHIAPGHGEEDYLLGVKYNLPIFSPVDDEGKFTSEAGEFKNIPIFKANSLIINRLEKNSCLLHQEEISHSYPHCWRCKYPLIFRATPQWFLQVDKHNLRKKAMAVDVNWIPPQSRVRMKSMLKERPDWCLSRQRYWGVGIPIIYCKACNKPMINKELFQKIFNLTLQHGSDVWFRMKVEEIIPPNFSCPNCKKNEFKKEKDIIDVWFESGISHQAVIAQEESLSYPADLYLEGSDQHRGWFQTSLLTSLAFRQDIPFKQVLTHGFVVDYRGKKMSKSIGNVIKPQEIIERKGADILRLWIGLEDYSQDIRISEEIINYTVEVYRRMRNTYRFLLGNLYDFDPYQDKLEPGKMREIDRYILSRFQFIIKLVTESFEGFKLYEAVHLLHNFATNDLSSFYFDVLKDRLYTFPANCSDRKSAQTTLWFLLLGLIKLMAPVLSFTTEEVWKYVKSLTPEIEREESIFLSSWPKENDKLRDESLERKWKRILRVRSKALKALEEARQDKTIASSLEAKIIIRAPLSLLSLLGTLGKQLKEIFIVSEVELVISSNLEIKIEKAKGKKCERCWNYSSYLGENKEHPTLCKRCYEIVKK